MERLPQGFHKPVLRLQIRKVYSTCAHILLQNGLLALGTRGTDSLLEVLLAQHKVSLLKHALALQLQFAYDTLSTMQSFTQIACERTESPHASHMKHSV
jgi:hypothetical protein